jgi:hypothetical protein
MKYHISQIGWISALSPGERYQITDNAVFIQKWDGGGKIQNERLELGFTAFTPTYFNLCVRALWFDLF